MRPIKDQLNLRHKHCSTRLERKICDFGIDHSFKKTCDKLKEHYNLDLPKEKVRIITERHAQSAQAYLEAHPHKGTAKETTIIAEMDGSMVPIVQPLDEAKETEKQDRRKKKTVCYREYRLALAHQQGSISTQMSGTFGDVDQSGTCLRNSVESIGESHDNSIHVVGDGATWIANQVEKQFGNNANFLVDLYHVCEYLADASKTCSGSDSPCAWKNQQKSLLKEGKLTQVLQNLLPHIEPPESPEDESPVRACYRYLTNREDQLDYKTALESGLPIGSGEIESAHKYIIQKRLKVPGAWWLEENASAIIAMRICRHNELWEDYWESVA